MLRASVANKIANSTHDGELQEILLEIEKAAKAGKFELYLSHPLKSTRTKQSLITLDYHILVADQRAIMDGWYYKISW
jgi:hypothetical protein